MFTCDHTVLLLWHQLSYTRQTTLLADNTYTRCCRSCYINISLLVCISIIILPLSPHHQQRNLSSTSLDLKTHLSQILSSIVTLIPSGLTSWILTCTGLKGHWRCLFSFLLFYIFLTTCARWSWIGYSAFESTLNSSFVSYHLCESQYWHLYYLAFTTASCITHLPSTNRLRYFSLRAAFMDVRLGDSTYWLLSLLTQQFLADRTNGRAYATVLRLSSSVCNVMYCG